ncbi:ergothioneine biosynthesis protein EgtB [Telmatospirillum sp. J64-1]|uniref:ergothioneine biosynthesis protein EgtB n=1 Tax=Telmatospirillum sp. J64-1 TaxID=2502183 RepID=UPI00115F4ED6|nr:ergothioneine biosynthesis protein EgtB [Telmatospirillum sp. J64-1]
MPRDSQLRRSDLVETASLGFGRAAAAKKYGAIRTASMVLSARLSPEDQTVQSMPDASPTKWHLGHTTWFFETLVLAPHMPGYRPFDPDFAYLFNSYYEALGERHPRPARGMLTRPSLDHIMDYRIHVDEAVQRLIVQAQDAVWASVAPLLELGLNHEQQHQELILTDILHLFSLNPLRPAFSAAPPPVSSPAPPLTWIDFEGGIHTIGHDAADPAFAYDNEGPRHEVLLRPFRLASRVVTNGEYAAFVADGGYERPDFWLSDGWAQVRAERWRHPLYWRRTEEGGWEEMTLLGPLDLDPHAPVRHLSFYEASAYANWAGKRLPSEAEWEVAAVSLGPDAPEKGNFADGPLLPRAARGTGLSQMFGDVWEWTCSPYIPYPGFRPASGAVGEYNGKFMCNQMVLRGGSCVTPSGHIRPSYRNFFYPSARWQVAGIRLAEDA